MVLGKIFVSPFKGLLWVFEEITRRVDAELYDVGKLQRELLELRQAFELGDISPEEYDAREEQLIGRLRAARERKLAEEEHDDEEDEDVEDDRYDTT
ncbi:MAG: hypothetical protein VR69_01900 [Peptococcaceae bacterium BRH_c4b]|nr:MAG: hypothetical protein VR69_01900 [Peptococcaceae bacterium BRH_c4b]